MLATNAPILAVMDADLQHDESILPKMFEQITTRNLDLVVATRNGAGGSKGNFERHRALMSDVGAKLSSLVLKSRLSDPMSGFFMITRECLHGLVRRLSAVGFKILVDIVASADRPLRVAEVPYVFGQRQFGDSKLDLNVTVEYFNLLVDKLSRGLLPARFVMFVLVGGLGVVVHLTALSILFAALHRPFLVAQTAATVIAMTSNFILNNVLTFRDSRLRGWKAFRGLLLFYTACSFGAFTNITVAYFIFRRQFAWYLAGVVGVAVSSVWNYATNSVFTWRKR
jgi:dolichol-phosphate mannosyltransferase